MSAAEVNGLEEPAAKKAKLETDAGEIKVEAVEKKADGEKKEKDGEKKEKDGEKKEKKEKDGEKKEKKEKKEKSDRPEGEEKKEKKDKGEKKEKHKDKEKKEHKEHREHKEKKEKKEKTGDPAIDGEKKEKKEHKEKKEKKEHRDKDGKKEKSSKEKSHKEKKEPKEPKEKKPPKPVKVRMTGGMGVKKPMLKKSVMGKFGKKLAAKKVVVAVERPTKVLVKTEDDYEPVNRWWEKEDGALSGKRGAKKWDTFEHHGLLFAPDYESHGIPMRYDKQEIKLPVDAEEVATYWTSVKGTDYESKPVFIKNFWEAFTDKLPEDLKKLMVDFKKCDFTQIQTWRALEREKRIGRSKDEKEDEKQKNATETAWYSHGLVNGVRERLGNYRLEPPQLFRGRGEHPKQGMLKKRTWPENCIINIGGDAPVPRAFGCPGHAWRDVVHENCVQWIAAFDDGVLGELKYVSFAATSGLKGQPDMLKYDRARRLLHVVDNIRNSYEKLQCSKTLVDRQKATATYFIDRLALRVGGEKDTEEEADTVGCCSLRVEHMKLEPPNILHLQFLGKDSIEYKNTVTVTDQVFTNITAFLKDKKPEEQVFDQVAPGVVNEYFKEFMDDLSAKVFRTYNASFTLQTELSKFDVTQKDKFTQDELVKFYNDANREVAVLCNHQKAASKSHESNMEKMTEGKELMSKNIKTLKKHLLSLTDAKCPGVKDPQIVLPKDPIACKKKIAELKMRLDKHENSMRDKEDNKLVSLGTSKVNYMDPRITVAWCKKVDLSIERVFSRTIRTKFPWAMHFKSSYLFD